MSVININDIHPLSCKWNLFSHLPHDTNWSLKSYEKIYFFENVEDVLDIYNILPDILIKNCMLFLMKDEINPIWEDPKNIKGGCWSLKIPKGTTISKEMLDIKRPGTGIPPKYFEKIIGSSTLKDIEEDIPINFEDISL